MKSSQKQVLDIKTNLVCRHLFLQVYSFYTILELCSVAADATSNHKSLPYTHTLHYSTGDTQDALFWDTVRENVVTLLIDVAHDCLLKQKTRNGFYLFFYLLHVLSIVDGV